MTNKPSRIISNSSIEDDIRILGYCDLKDEIIAELVDKRRFNQIIEAGGEFTIVYKNDNEIGIITSMIGAIHYFYYYDGRKFSHSDRIIDIIKEVNIIWEWDWESLGDLCAQENLTENRTLHRSIKRVPPGCILRFTDRLVLQSRNYLDGLKCEDADPVVAVEILNNETKKWITRNPYLSLSGGFDSRVILSSMLNQNIYPHLVTLGERESTDRMVSEEIAKKFGLEHTTITLSLQDMLESGVHIADITNGSKPACHWHTFLYPMKAGVPKDESFYVGTLGEFARCYYFDKGVLSLLFDASPQTAQELFWKLKLDRHKTFKNEELGYLCPELRIEVCDEGIVRKAKRNARLSRGDFLSGGARYYLEQRVPNFYANGIRMYNETTNWRSPFHNRDWLKVIWYLCDNWKLGSNWHRLAIKRNYPALLEFPEEKGFSTTSMLIKAPPLYWLPMAQRMKYISYDLSQNWYRDSRIKSLILDNAGAVSELIDSKLCEIILEEHDKLGNRTKAISFILTILFFRLALCRGI